MLRSPFPFLLLKGAGLVPRGRWGGEPDCRNTDSRRLNPTEGAEASFTNNSGSPPNYHGSVSLSLVPFALLGPLTRESALALISPFRLDLIVSKSP